MTTAPQLRDAYCLFHEGILALSQVETDGIRVDVPYLDRALVEIEEKIKALRERLRTHEVGRKWQRHFGLKMNLDSREQLGVILFSSQEKGGMGYKVEVWTGSGRPSTEESELEKLEIGYVKGWLRYQKLQKARSTYLMGIRREVVGGYVHPVYNLHFAITYRSSSDSPNFQNQPVRDPEMAKLIRTAFIASPGCVLVEHDLKGAEVCVAACYHKDPVMIDYIKDETKDMHRDMAMQLYFLEKGQVNKPIRHAAKNKFVFPQFYNDWYIACARALWEAIDRSKLTVDGRSLREHLLDHGMTGLGALDPEQKPRKGTFEKHVQDVEHDFWGRRFKEYAQWKKRWYEAYLKKGYFTTLTGFRIAGAMKRNEVINYPIQGSAFHCLLWILIQTQAELRRRKMRTRIVGQVHDSMVADVPVEELDVYLAMVEQIATVQLPAYWKWIIVPMEMESAVCPLGTSWYDKREIVRVDTFNYRDPEGDVGTAKGLIKHWNHTYERTH